ncbi:MAG: glycosyltransferase, partial [Lachnospiraceae bacterium]|nr:glycosyltransferase [Lachnospiraceae bacterium]
IISKNEEKHIENCLSSIKKLGCEIIVTDTGSNDNTEKIAAKYADKISHFQWINDFSAAKNYSASLASNDLILSIDCDEYLQNFDSSKFLSLIKSKPDCLGTILLQSTAEDTSSNEKNLINERVTRFYDRRIFSFKGSVHETVSPISADMEVSYIDLPLFFHHAGYDSASVRKEKAKKYLEMLLNERKTEGSSPYNCFQIARCLRTLNDNEGACEYLSEALSFDVNPSLSYVQQMVEDYGYSLLELKKYSDALNLYSVYDVFAVRADFLFLMGLIFMNNGLFDKAILEFEKATKMTSFSVEGTNSYKAYYNVGVIYEVLGNKEKAIHFYKLCGQYKPAVLRLAQIHN